MYKNEAKRLGQGKLFKMMKHVDPGIMEKNQKVRSMVLKEANLSETDPHFRRIWGVFRKELVKNIRTKRNTCVGNIRERYLGKECRWCRAFFPL